MNWWFFHLQKIGTSRLTTYLLRNGKNMLMNLFDVDAHSGDSNEMWWAKHWAHHNSIQDEVNNKEHEQLIRDGATRSDGWCLHVLTIFDPLTQFLVMLGLTIWLELKFWRWTMDAWTETGQLMIDGYQEKWCETTASPRETTYTYTCNSIR